VGLRTLPATHQLRTVEEGGDDEAHATDHDALGLVPHDQRKDIVGSVLEHYEIMERQECSMIGFSMIMKKMIGTLKAAG
jgi:hypothetical protein